MSKGFQMDTNGLHLTTNSAYTFPHLPQLIHHTPAAVWNELASLKNIHTYNINMRCFLCMQIRQQICNILSLTHPIVSFFFFSSKCLKGVCKIRLKYILCSRIFAFSSFVCWNSWLDIKLNH